ncbi:MAG: hypothetical protein QM673_07480 [Gordonia sp. (in: high G+C Gram-positive bacteria)]
MVAMRASRFPRYRPQQKRRRRLIAATATSATVLLALAGCGSSSDQRTNVATVLPATAPSAPPRLAAQPAGRITPLKAGGAGSVGGGSVGGTVMTRSGNVLAVLSAPGTTLLRIPTTTGAAPLRPVTTPHLTAVIGTGAGAFLGVGPKVLARVAADGSVSLAPIGSSEPTALARTRSGQIVVGAANGHVLVFDGSLRQIRDIGGFVRVDAITVSPASADLAAEQVVVLDRAQSSVTPVNLSSGELGAALRAGNGATNITVDHFGRIIAANTRDNEILGFFGSPLVMRFRYPVAHGPYAVDYDDTRNLLWVSTTANNEVVAYDLAGGEPVEKYRFASVAQPDAIAVDDSTGVIYVLSARGDGLQTVAPPYGPGATATSSGR